MKKFFTITSMMVSLGLFAQPTIDGFIDTGNNEYAYSDSNTTQTWYMEWDQDYLYIGITGAPILDFASVYFDFSIETPVNTEIDGSNSGFNVNITPNLPFSSDVMVSFNNGGQTIRRAFSSGAWSDVAGATILYADNATNNDTREIRIAWSDLVGSNVPEEFNWLGFLSYDFGTYGDMPNTNISGNLGSNNGVQDKYRYFAITNTSTINQTPAFANDSYTHIGGIAGGFEDISVYNFTMNTNGQIIIRDANNGFDWNIENLVVGDGTIFFGASGSNYGNTNITNLDIMGGTLNMDQTNQPMNVTGDINIDSGGELILSSSSGGDLNMSGNITIIDGSLNTNHRAIVFQGNQAQLLFSTDDVNIDFWVVDNNSATYPSVILNADVTVDNELTLTEGVIQLNDHQITMAANSTVSGASSNSYVATNGTGKVTYAIVNTSVPVLFPIGTEIGYAGVVLSNLGGSADESFSASVSDMPPTNLANPDASLFASWDIEELIDGGNTVSLDIEWTEGMERPGFIRTEDIVIGHQSSMGWEEFPATLTGSSPQWTASASGFTSFSPFSIGNTGAFPVELTSFDVVAQSRGHLLTWTTASEINNDYFEILHTTELDIWKTIGRVSGVGTSNIVREYEFLHTTPQAGINYYQLKQVDYDGTESRSNVISIDYNLGSTWTIFPNPIVDELSIATSLSVDQEIIVRLFDNTGRLIFEEIKDISENTTVAIDEINSGLYILQILDANGQMMLQRQVVKE